MLNWIERKMLNRINKKMGIKVTKDNLLLAFNDDSGNGYYKFPSGMEMPVLRIAKLQEFLMWLMRGASREEYLRAIGIAEAALQDGIKNPKSAAKIGFVLQELKNRSEMVIHDELFYNIIAVQLVRHDEDPTKFNNEIHLQKVEDLKEMDKKDDTFFLHIQEFLAVFNLSNVGRVELETLMNVSRVTRQAMDKMESILSEK